MGMVSLAHPIDRFFEPVDQGYFRAETHHLRSFLRAAHRAIISPARGAANSGCRDIGDEFMHHIQQVQ